MKATVLFLGVFLAFVEAGAREVVLLGARETTPVLAVAAGGELTLDVVIPASLDRSKIEVGLWQTSGGLGLPLGNDIALAASPDAHGITPVRLVFPKLARKTRVLVKFTTKDEPRSTLGIVQVQVYPAFDWAPMARTLRKDGLRILVFGEGEALRAFFKTREVEFADNGENLPDRLDRDTIAVGSLSAKDWADGKDRIAREGGGLIVFVADSGALPGVYERQAGEGAITKVTLPAPGAPAQDPRGEELLFQLIERHLRETAGTNLF